MKKEPTMSHPRAARAATKVRDLRRDGLLRPSTTVPLGLLVLTSLLGCAATRGDAERQVRALPVSHEPQADSNPVGASPESVGVSEASARDAGEPTPSAEVSPQDEPAGSQIVAAGRTRLHPEELTIWNDPRFKRQFAESYLSETEIEPRVTLLERDTMEKVRDLMANDRLDRAFELVESKRGPGTSAVFDMTIAKLHEQRDELDQATAAFRTAVGKFPNFRRAWQGLGSLQARSGNFADAVSSLTRVIELGGGNAVTYGVLGYSYEKIGSHLAAESGYRMASLLDPVTMDWKVGLARTLFKQQRFADAAAITGTLIAEHPDNSDLWNLQANAFLGLKEVMHAAENFEIVDRLGGSDTETLGALGDIYANERLFGMAVDAYERAMAAAPTQSPARFLLAAEFMSRNGEREATRRLVAEIEERLSAQLAIADHKHLLQLRARIALAEGAGEDEARALEQVVELDPLDGDAIIVLGEFYDRSGDPQRAVFQFERAAKLDGFEARAKVAQARSLVLRGKYAEAIPLLERAQSIDPRPTVQDYLEKVRIFARRAEG